jgi:hypothetical protein
VLLTDQDRRGTEAIAGEHASYARALGQPKYGQVAAIGFANASLSDADFNTGNRVNSVVRRNMQINGHGGSQLKR